MNASMNIRDIREDRAALADLTTRIQADELERRRRCGCHQCQKRIAAMLDGTPAQPQSGARVRLPIER
jgi:hypothetical protein